MSDGESAKVMIVWELLFQVSTMLRTIFLYLILSSAFNYAHASSETLHIAAASNFKSTLLLLVQHFKQQGHKKITVSYGSTGKLYAQIIHGAPYDIFLAADTARPKRLETQGLLITGSRFNYAQGRLALISINKQSPPLLQLKSSNFSHLAIANPKLAPYGLAAQQVLQRLDLWQIYQKKIVRGENIAQTLLFTHSGNAQLGFIALTQLKEMADKHNYWIPPDDWYTAINQQAGLLKHGQTNATAKAFLLFLKSDASQRIIKESGYYLPLLAEDLE